MVNLRFSNPLIWKHIRNLFSKIGFIKWPFKCSKINKLGNFGFSILSFWPRPPTYLYYSWLVAKYNGGIYSVSVEDVYKSGPAQI